MKVLTSTVCFLLCCSHALSQGNDIKVTWGLESEAYHIEQKVARDHTQAIRVEAKRGEKLYRYFTTTESYTSTAMDLFAAQNDLWDGFQESGDGTEGSDASVQRAFQNYVSRKRPALREGFRELAPSLFFDFVGRSGKEYVLDSIRIETLTFDEYAGGGFIDNEAWYDILLRHSVGTHTYAVEKKLRFTSSGRTVLRFWSDNFYKSAGMSPMGCYMIDISFFFTSNGKVVKVTTTPFKMDV